MSRSNIYLLRNLGTATKLAISLGLLLGFALFLSGWVVSVTAINRELSWMGVIHLGGGVGMLGADLRWVLLAAHCVSLAALLPLSLALVRRMPLPRLTRRALFAVTTALALADVATWLLLPLFAVAQSVLGALVLLLTPLLGYLVGAPLQAMWKTRSWSEPERPVRVVIVGGGFAGLDAALGLDAVLGWSSKLELTVIDRKNYFLFPPLLPSVAVGAIETRQVTCPFRRIFEGTNIRFKKEAVEEIDIAGGKLISQVDIDADADGGALRVRHDETPFDYLVVAPGSTTQTFNTPGAEHAFFMRELGDAIALRNHIIDCFETAAREPDRELTRKMLRFVVIGAGPTGVEVASEVRDLIDKVLLPRYLEVDASLVDVVLVDSGDRVLKRLGRRGRPQRRDSVGQARDQGAAPGARLRDRHRLGTFERRHAARHQNRMLVRGGRRLTFTGKYRARARSSGPGCRGAGLPRPGSRQRIRAWRRGDLPWQERQAATAARSGRIPAMVPKPARTWSGFCAAKPRSLFATSILASWSASATSLRRSAYSAFVFRASWPGSCGARFT